MGGYRACEVPPTPPTIGMNRKAIGIPTTAMSPMAQPSQPTRSLLIARWNLFSVESPVQGEEATDYGHQDDVGAV